METWKDLADAINKLSKEEQNQPIQCILSQPNCDAIEECLPAVSFDTIGNLEFAGSRSTYDNKYHAEDYILYLDHNIFAEDGAWAYEWKDGFDTLKDNPIYGKGGKTKREDQMGPEMTKEFTEAEIQLINKSIKEL